VVGGRGVLGAGHFRLGALAAAAAAAPPPAQPAPPTAAEERAALLAKTDTLKIPLGATKDPAAAGVSGDVVWDPATQRGFLHFAGLAPNDPAIHQYQIWIFDAGRDKRYPVDGGVFDVPANAGEVVIPIRASLMVRKPAAFAVTVEKPGGVVVSGREHVVALGATS
jgi:anti-sigma-K factor RskA